MAFGLGYRYKNIVPLNLKRGTHPGQDPQGRGVGATGVVTAVVTGGVTGEAREGTAAG